MTKRKQAGGPEVAVRNTKKRERQIQEEKRKQVKQAAFDQKLARMLSALQVEKSEAASASKLLLHGQTTLNVVLSCCSKTTHFMLSVFAADPQAKKKKPTGYHNLGKDSPCYVTVSCKATSTRLENASYHAHCVRASSNPCANASMPCVRNLA